MNEYIEWGKWARHNPDRLNYPSPWLEMIMRDNVPSTLISYTITDEQAVAIDKAVARLARHSVVLYRVFCLRYLACWSLRQIAKDYLTPLEYPHQIGMSDDDSRKKMIHPQIVKRLLEQAELFVCRNL